MSFDPSLPDETVNVSDGSAVGEAVWLVVGVVGVAVITVALFALTIDVAVRWIPPSVEARIFDGWAEDGLEAVADPESGEIDPRRARVQSLLDRMKSHWPDAPYRFRIHIAEMPDANAFALPGGFVVVSSGLLDRVETENELAFVLGHELGHFKNRDHLRGLGRSVAWGIVSAALGIGESGASALAQVAGGLSNRHFDRDQELASDEFGLELLAAEYGHVGGSAAVFADLLAVDDDDPGSDVEPDAAVEEDQVEDVVEVLAGYLSTHPTHADRIDQLAGYARERGWDLDGSPVPWIADDPYASQGIADSPE